MNTEVCYVCHSHEQNMNLNLLEETRNGLLLLCIMSMGAITKCPPALVPHGVA